MKTIRQAAGLLLLLALVACGTVEMQDTPEPEPPAGEPAETPGGGGGDESGDEYLPVSQLAAEDDGAYVEMAGYVVGSVSGNMTTGTRFGTDGAVDSNLLLADTPDETDPQRCAPVQLVSGTAAREVLNLVDHPENLGVRVLICGYKKTYFGTAGIKLLQDYAFLDGKPAPQPFPLLSPDPAQVFEGS